MFRCLVSSAADRVTASPSVMDVIPLKALDIEGRWSHSEKELIGPDFFNFSKVRCSKSLLLRERVRGFLSF